VVRVRDEHRQERVGCGVGCDALVRAGPGDAVHEGRVSVDLGAVLSASARLLRDTYGRGDIARRYRLDTAAFGVEYGTSSGDPLDSGATRFSARISEYCLALRTPLVDAAGG
jgi:hypothetical protein